MTISMDQIEVDLTPVNIRSPNADWLRIEDITIRRHHTARGLHDKYMQELPDHVLANMREQLSEVTIQRLLHEDFLPQIDWSLYSKHCNGGCALHLCIKP
jgi:hypothetical protein